MENRMKVRMIDIAQECGVSKALVSRVINNDPTLKVPDSTREKILSVVERMGYIPDQNARQLSYQNPSARNRQFKIGYITFTSNGKLGHPFFSHIVEGIMMQAQEMDCMLTMAVSIDEFCRDYFYQKKNNIEAVDGLILLGRVEDPRLKKYLKKLATHIIVMDGYFDADADFVGTNFMKSLQLAMDYIVECGYQSIGMLTGEQSDRLAFCTEYLNSKGVTLEPDWVLNCGYMVSSGYKIVNEQLKGKKPPRAIMAWNDEMALGCLKALIQNGYRVPEDVALIGHDDINMAAYAEVPLTTVKIYKRELGKLAVKVLLDRLSCGRKVPICVEIPGKLKVRESMNKIHKQDGI